MNNQVMLIDQVMLLESLKKELEFCVKEKFNERNTRFYLGRETVLTDIIKQIETGKFAPDTPPVPTIKPGDKVRHKDWPLYGVGTVISIAKSGLRARVEFKDSVGMWGTPLDAYYLLDKLEVVE